MATDLKTEITVDELGRGYSSMTDQQVADDLNTAYRTRDHTNLTASEVYNAIVQAEVDSKTADEKAEVDRILSLGEVNPFGREATQFTAIFGAGSATLTALKAARVEAITRATELELGFVRAGHVEFARAS